MYPSGSAHTPGPYHEVAPRRERTLRVPGDVNHAWCRRNGCHTRGALGYTEVLARFGNILPVIRRSRPRSGAISACRSGQSKFTLRSAGRPEAASRSTQSAKIHPGPAGTLGYRQAQEVRCQPLCESITPSKGRGPSTGAPHPCERASTLRSPPMSYGPREVPACW